MVGSFASVAVVAGSVSIVMPATATTPVRLGAASTNVDLNLLVPTRNAALMQQYLAKGKVISPATYQHLFGATPASMSAVEKWARSTHLTVRGSSPATGQVQVTAPASTVASALHVQMKQITRHGVKGLTALGQPRASTAAVMGVSGLNTTTQMKSASTLQPASTRATLGAALTGSKACSSHWGDNLYPSVKKYTAESNQICGYTPKDLTTMYAAASLQKQTPTLGIIGWGNDPDVKTLTNQYMSQAGYPVLSSYSTVVASPDDSADGCDMEGAQAQQAIAVQASHAIAPASPIIYYGAASCDASDVQVMFQKAVDAHKTSTLVLPMAAISETDLSSADIAAWNRTAAQAALTGMTVVAASGDYGNGSSVNTDGKTHPSFPASSPYVTAVGGTAVGMKSDGSQPVLAGWENRTFEQDDPTKASFADVTSYISGAGGGASQVFTSQPTWQVGVTGSIKSRAVPDVSALADPYTGFSVRYTSYDANDNAVPTYGTWGGTSLSAAIVATSTALAKASVGKAQGLGNLAGTFYSARTSNVIRDVNSPNAAGVFYASPYGGYYVIGLDAKPENLVTTAGWDPVTGVGTINATNLAAWLKTNG